MLIRAFGFAKGVSAFWLKAAAFVVRQWRAEGAVEAVGVLLCAVRLLPFSRAMCRLHRLPAFANHVAKGPQGDPLCHLHHRHFLSRALSFRQRLAWAQQHFAFEHERCTSRYLDLVFRPQGLLLWQQVVEGVDYRLVLSSPPSGRHEGPLSVVLEIDGRAVHVQSLVWLAGVELAPASADLPDTVALITRNQSLRFGGPEVKLFRQHFPQNSPHFFCLAAVHGLVQWHGQDQLAGIRHDCQIAYEPAFDASFVRSYSDLWTSMGGQPLASHAYLMPVPAPIRDVAELDARHRKRARMRRNQWADITASTLQALQPHRRSQPASLARRANAMAALALARLA